MTTTDIANRRRASLVRANGIDIAYIAVGEGPPMVLLHGAFASTSTKWGGSGAAFVDHMTTLAEHFHVIAPDTRGSGATVHPGGAATVDVLADDVVAMIEALGLDRPLIAGFSEGGATASVLALRHPGVVRALVNHAGFDYFDPDAFANQSLRPIFGGAPDATRADPDAAEQAFQQMGPDAARTFATMKADYDDAQGDEYWRRYLEIFFERHVAGVDERVEDLAALTVPTLILVGDRDPFCTVEAACLAYRALPSGELAVVPNTGHEITAATVGVTVDFLLRHVVDG
jgi:pimeloyl-ACP methyl ester carboxylesterase